MSEAHNPNNSSPELSSSEDVSSEALPCANKKPGSETQAPDLPSGKELLLNIVINIVIPVVILSYFSKPEYLGPKLGLVVALAFPVLYGCKDFVQNNKTNWFSIIGVVTLLLTGGMGLLGIDPKYIAIKEAAVPGLIGLAVLISLKTPYPLVKTMILKNPMIRTEVINQALEEHNATDKFNKTLTISTLILASSNFLAAFTNYFLAIIVLKSPPGTEAFNEELARMIALSYPVNALPASIVMMFAVFYTIRCVEKFTHLKFEDIINLPDFTKEKPGD